MSAALTRTQAEEGDVGARPWLGIRRAYGKGQAGRARAEARRRHVHSRHACHVLPESRPACRISPPRPLGIVIGHGGEIDENAPPYQNATLGQDGPFSGHLSIGAAARLRIGRARPGSRRVGRDAVRAPTRIPTQGEGARLV